MADMSSLERVKRLGQIKGMAYEPTPSDVIMKGVTPNCYDPGYCRDFDMDYFNSDFVDLWGIAGRQDLSKIAQQGVNMMRLYNWSGNETGGTPLRDHTSFLADCAVLGLGVMVPFSNYNATIPAAKAQNTANSIVNELLKKHAGALHPVVKMWQPTNEFELTTNIKAEDVARLVEYLVRAEEAAGITADANKIPIVVGVSTAEKFGVPGQSMGQIEALRLAFHTGGRLPDGTEVQANNYLNGKRVWETRFVIGIQSFQYLGEVRRFVDAVSQKYANSLPVLLTEHGYDSVNAAKVGPPLPGNGGANDEANQARIVAKQIADADALYRDNPVFRGMCFFQWLNVYYKCGVRQNPNDPNSPVIYSNTCTEANFGQMQWNAFGAGRPTPTKYGKTRKGQTYPVDDAKLKPVHPAVTVGFRGP
jgi:hypothetical protein